MTAPRPRFAAIDLGTNTCLLLVAEWDGRQLTELASEMRTVRLGEGVAKSGEVSPAAMERAMDTFREYSAIIAGFNVSHVRYMGTSAFRSARNGQLLAERLHSETGYTLEAVNGAEEAALVYEVIRREFPLSRGSRVITDIGGGSTEIIVEQDSRPIWTGSLELGTVSLTERFLHRDPPEESELKDAGKAIQAALAQVSDLEPAGSMVGVGGTATTLLAMALELQTYEPRRIHGQTLSRSALDAVVDHCIALPYKKRRRLAGLHPGRADVIIAGGLIQRAVMDLFRCDRILVSDRGLQWGAVYRMVSEGRAV